MLLPRDDTGLSADLRAHGVREPTATQAYQRELARLTGPVTVVEIGANVGYYALQPLAVRPDARVIAIEPDPRNVRVLRANIDLNDYGERVTVMEGAVGRRDASSTLTRMEESNLGSLRDAGSGTRTDAIEVRTRQLGAYLDAAGITPADVDVLRMDVEGHEVAVLEGARNVLTAADELLCHIELHPTLYDPGEADALDAMLDERDMDVVCVATNNPEASHAFEGVRALCRRYWSPQVVFTWRPRGFA